MKKKFLMVLMGLLLVACGGDGGDDILDNTGGNGGGGNGGGGSEPTLTLTRAQVVGIWKDTYGRNSLTEDWVATTNPMTHCFDEDGTYRTLYQGKKISEGTWTITGNKIVVTATLYTDTYEVLSLEGDEMEFAYYSNGTLLNYGRVERTERDTSSQRVTNIELNDNKIKLLVTMTTQLTAEVKPEDAANKKVSWLSSNPSIATVDNDGLVTAVAEGTSIITCSATDGSGVTAECQIVVEKTEVVFQICPDNHHPHAIDLGLPSGTKWCCCNVGASTPEGYGGRYAWGETSEKSEYSWDTYKYYTGEKDKMYRKIFTKYGHDDLIDELDPSDDAAMVNMGAPWRMPTREQMVEFIDNCRKQKSMACLNGVYGLILKGPNGNKIFLPGADYVSEAWGYHGYSGSFWSRLVNVNDWDRAIIMGFDWNDFYGFDLLDWPHDKPYSCANRYDGLFVRAVCP